MHSALLHAALAPARVSLPAVGPPDTLATVCKPNPGIACRLVWDISHNTKAADLTTVFFAGPAQVIARIAFVLLIAVILRIAARRVIGRVTTRAKENAARRADRTGSVFNERRNPRASALGSVLSNAATIVIFGIATVIILGDMGVNLAPILAGAGVLGIAIGFGAQNLVQDFLAGIFMLLEDQFGVGDVIAIGDITGTVEAVSFRITRLRDVNGVAWYVRNGTISQAGNESQGWARAVVDFPVSYDRDIPRVRQLMMAGGRRHVAGAGLAWRHSRGTRGLGGAVGVHRQGRGPAGRQNGAAAPVGGRPGTAGTAEDRAGRGGRRRPGTGPGGGHGRGRAGTRWPGRGWRG